MTYHMGQPTVDGLHLKNNTLIDQKRTEKNLTFRVEVTDCLGHEVNYSWVQRYTLDVPADISDYALVRRAKKAIGWTGRRTTTTNYGDTIELRPMGAALVCFITLDTDAIQ